MKNKEGVSFVVYDDASLDRAKAWLNNFKRTEGVDMEVVVRPYQYSLSRQQQKTLRWWYRIWSVDDPATRTPEALHDYCKEKLLLKILEQNDEAYRIKMQELRALYRAGEIEQANREHKTIVWLSSTTQLTTKQMANFMEQVKEEALSLNITLPDPEPDPRKRT